MTPNPYIPGAAKSGTTALAAFLSAHPAVFPPHAKEPCWWSFDLSRGNATVQLDSQADYDRLYAPADALSVRYALGASTSYLHSDAALERILERRPDRLFSGRSQMRNLR